MGQESIAHHLLYNGTDIEFTAAEAAVLIKVANGENRTTVCAGIINDHIRLGYLSYSPHSLLELTEKGRGVVKMIRFNTPVKSACPGELLMTKCLIRPCEIDQHREHLKKAICAIKSISNPSDHPLDANKNRSIQNLLNDARGLRDSEFIEGYLVYIQTAYVLAGSMEDRVRVIAILNTLLI